MAQVFIIGIFCGGNMDVLFVAMNISWILFRTFAIFKNINIIVKIILYRPMEDRTYTPLSPCVSLFHAHNPICHAEQESFLIPGPCFPCAHVPMQKVPNYNFYDHTYYLCRFFLHQPCLLWWNIQFHEHTLC